MQQFRCDTARNGRLCWESNANPGWLFAFNPLLIFDISFLYYIMHMLHFAFVVLFLCCKSLFMNLFLNVSFVHFFFHFVCMLYWDSRRRWITVRAHSTTQLYQLHFSMEHQSLCMRCDRNTESWKCQTKHNFYWCTEYLYKVFRNSKTCIVMFNFSPKLTQKPDDNFFVEIEQSEHRMIFSSHCQ